MDIGVTIVPLEIEGVSEAGCRSIENRLSYILGEWRGSVHRDGQQCKGVAVDCVRFVSAVVDELYGIQTEIEKLPPDAAFHSKETTLGAFRNFMSKYPHTKVGGKEIQPGDILITGPRGGGPGHAIVVGVRNLWHCDSYSVVPTGTYLSNGGVYFLKTILRGADRHLWVR